jgi:hypothetical protein
MIQTLLTLAVVGILVAHLLTLFWSSKNEHFSDFVERKGMSRVGPNTGEDPLNLNELANPQPFHPLAGGPVLSPADSTRKVATPYRDLQPDSQEDLESDDDPRDLPWIASWSAADRFARQGQNCAVKYIKEDQDGTVIITTSKSCEAGMPHTRAGGRVCIPDSVPEALRADIIAHELIHVIQRRYPEAWATFYRRNWSFQFHKEPSRSMPASVREARRANPDTFEVPWPCWMGRYWPVPVYTNPQAPSLRDARTVWWDEWQQKVLLEPPAAWTTFFGQPSQDEHPHEIAAVMIVAADTMTEAGRRLMNWWLSTGSLIKSDRWSKKSIEGEEEV